MKHFTCQNRPSKQAGFTLVELLVVIGIIAILAAVLIPAAQNAFNSAKRAKAANTATQLQAAVINFYTEYSVYPVTAAATPVDTLVSTAANWQAIIPNLTGGLDPGNPSTGQIAGNINTRQISYITFSPTDLDSTQGAPSIPKTPFPTSTNQPQYFQMAIDSDYSGVLGDSGAGTQPPSFAGLGATPIAPGAIPTKSLAVGVAVWANCDPYSTTTLTHPNFWVHTY